MIYVMVNSKKLFRAKIGFSNSPERRSREVNASIVMKLSLPLPSWSYPVEKALHRFFSIYRSKERRSDGSTEWFYCVNILAPLVMYLCDTPIWYLFFAPLPIDIVLIAVMLWLVVWLILIAPVTLFLMFVIT